jgi:GT2 family glycosyltransferase
MLPNPDNRSSSLPKVSLVVLTFNSEKFIGACLESLAAVDYPNLEIVVVDNASSDATVEKARAVGHFDVLIPNRSNRGCAGGYNDGWHAASGEIVLFLNPDTTVDRRIATALVEAFGSYPRAAVCGCKILYPDRRTIWHAGGILHPNAMTNHLGKGEQDNGQYDEAREIDYASGCAVAVRRGFLERSSGFNEDYWPGYYEEVDLCWRARRMGHEVKYVPCAIVYHHESQSFKLYSPTFFHYYYRNRIRFLVNNYTWRDWLHRFLPFEYRWWRQIPESHGYRLRQVRYYFAGLAYALGKLFRRQREK